MNTYHSAEQHLAWVRNEFLDAVSEHAPQVLHGLHDEPFACYRERPVPWLEFVCRSEKSETLRESLDAWATHWQLQADWCFEAAIWTLHYWNCCTEKPFELAFQSLGWSTNYPHLEPPVYRPEFGREAYSKAVEEYVAAIDALRPPITTQEKRKLDVHLEWAVQHRVLGKSYSQLSREAGVKKENVSRRVREVLTLIVLP